MLIDFIKNATTGLIIGFKGVFAYTNYNYFIDDTFIFLFSVEGSLKGAISGLILGLCYTLYKKKNNKYTEPIYEEEDIKPQNCTNILLISALSGLIGHKFFTNLKIGMILYLAIGQLFSGGGLTFMGV